ncbi:hypothetical protein D4R99_00815 [bacterium]|nr:MAG: hypothetical protein D4R99_00815 [bacterium]
MEKEQLKKIKDIMLVNEDLRERSSEESWSVQYNKKADILTIGTTFPVGSFYYNLSDTGVMLRIDSNNKIYGFAVENTKYFMKRNPEVGISLYPIVYPIRSRVLFPIFSLVFSVKYGLSKIQSIGTLTDFVAGRASFV